jgi:RND family efflux transporter MFP subunit
MLERVSPAIEIETQAAADPAQDAPELSPAESPTQPATATSHRRRPRFARWIALLVLLAAGVGVSYRLIAPPTLRVIHPVRGPAVQAAYATGTVEATVMVPISARTTARLIRLDADEGAQVSQGQVLAQLEDDDLRRSIDEAIAEERYARAEFERQAVLVERSVVSRTSYDRARANWVKAKAASDRATVQADFLKLVAPADGRIIRRDGEIGQLIGANQTVFWMSCCAPLRISAEVDEEDIAQVQPGQPVLLRADAFPGRVFNGTVQSITPKGDPVARSYRVRVALPDDTPLMIGMTAETNVILRRDEHALLLPAASVAHDSVWVVEDNRLVRRKVTIGARTPDAVEIRAGVADDDWIVASPAADLTAGEAVHAAPATAPR